MGRCYTTPALHSVTLMCSNLAVNGQDGNTRRHVEWNNSTERGTFYQLWLNTRKLFCAPRAVLEVVVSSLLCPRVFSRGSTRTSSGCCRLHLPLSPASCFCRCGHPLDSRGHHRAACAQAGVLLLKLLQLATAGKQVPVSERMSSSGTWISESPSTTVAVWRFLLRASHDMACTRAHLSRIARPPEARQAGGPCR